MALISSCSYSIGFGGISCPRVNPRKARHCLRHGQLGLAFSASHFGGFNTESRFVAWRKEFVIVRQLQWPLRNVRMDFLVLILRTVNWVFGKFWWFFFFFLVLGYGCCQQRLGHGSPPVVGQCLVSSHSPLRVGFYNWQKIIFLIWYRLWILFLPCKLVFNFLIKNVLI